MEMFFYRAADRALAGLLPEDKGRDLVLRCAITQGAAALCLALPAKGIVGMFAELGFALAGFLCLFHYFIALCSAWSLVVESRKRAATARTHGHEASQGQGRPWVLRSRELSLYILLADAPLLLALAWTWWRGRYWAVMFEL